MGCFKFIPTSQWHGQNNFHVEPAKYHFHPFKFWAEQMSKASKPFWKTKKENGHFRFEKAWRSRHWVFSSQQLHLADQKADGSLDQVGEMLYALWVLLRESYTFHTKPGQLFTRFGCFFVLYFFLVLQQCSDQTDYQFPGKSRQGGGYTIHDVFTFLFSFLWPVMNTLGLASSHPFERPKFQIRSGLILFYISCLTGFPWHTWS